MSSRDVDKELVQILNAISIVSGIVVEKLKDKLKGECDNECKGRFIGEAKRYRIVY